MASKETIRKHGQILVDFANSENTDEACLSFFSNIQDFLSFSPGFDEHIKKVFPFLSPYTEPMNETEKKILELILKEKKKKFGP